MRERDQANSNTMQIRTDFEKLLLQSNQVRHFSLESRSQKQRIIVILE